MMIGLRQFIVGTLFLGFALTGAAYCASEEAPTYPVGAGDILQITIYAGGAEQEDFTSQVSSNGTIAVPLLGDASVADMLPAEVAGYLVKRLSRGYYVNPQVVVTVKEYGGKVYLLGELRRPGAYGIRDAPTLLNACIFAGGFTDYAAQNRIRVTRTVRGRTQTIKIDVRKIQKGKQPDLFLFPGDRIEVPHRRF